MKTSHHYLHSFILLLICFFPSYGSASLAYRVSFSGVDDPKAQELLGSASDLVRLQSHPPSTQAVLRRRAEADIPLFIKVLQSLAYYNAKIAVKLDFDQTPIQIQFNVSPGPVYPFKNFSVIFNQPEYVKECLYPIEPCDLGILLGEKALPQTINQAKENLLFLLARKGFPFAVISKTEVIADQTAKNVSVVLHVDNGPQMRFGQLSIRGSRNVKPAFFNTKIDWEEGAVYNIKKVQSTRNALEASRLFSSVTITPEKPANEKNGCVPIVIDVIESKHNSIGLGASFTTQRGSGVTADWETRNFRGMGERLRFNANLWQQTREVTFLYVKPDFYKRGREFHGLLEYQYENTKGYRESSFSLSGTIERRVNCHLWLSYGLMFKELSNWHSDHNGNYNLLKFPVQLRWTNVDNLIDPIAGYSIYCRLIPTAQILRPQFGYGIATLTGTSYYALNYSESFILATKGMFGTIQGSPRRTIPPSERFYAGSETNLRGYAYRTVSPLNDKHKPIGGRSLLTFSAELRFRPTENFGFVGFYDFGNVYASPLPQLFHSMLHSVGMGVRYYTPVGPLRLDVAFPLNRRKHVDGFYQLYLSVGQAF